MTRPPALSGRRVAATGLLTGVGGLLVALFLRTIVANTPTRLSPEAQLWVTLLLSAFGVVAGLAVEAVRQLQRHNPDPEYHRHRRRGRRGGGG